MLSNIVTVSNSLSPKNFSVMKDNQAQKKSCKKLQSFDIKNDTVQCAVASELRALFPYVKQLLQLFPQLKRLERRFFSVKQGVVLNRLAKAHWNLTLMLRVSENF